MKTKYLCYNGNEQDSIRLRSEYILEVKEFDYLESTETSKKDSEKEICGRVQAGWNC